MAKSLLLLLVEFCIHHILGNCAHPCLLTPPPRAVSRRIEFPLAPAAVEALCGAVGGAEESEASSRFPEMSWPPPVLSLVLKETDVSGSLVGVDSRLVAALDLKFLILSLARIVALKAAPAPVYRTL